MEGVIVQGATADEVVGGARHLLLTVPEAASELRVHRMTVYRLLEEGKLRAVRVRAALRIPRAELEKFIADQLPQRRARRTE